MTFIVTASGAEIDLSSPETTEHNIGDIAHSLAMINRFNGHTRRKYSVAEHSLLVAELVKQRGAHVHAQLAALMHDAHEYITGDMATPLKHLLRGEWHHIEREWSASIAKSLCYHNPDHYHYSVIKQADLVALATEKRDLLPRTPTAWPVLEGIEPSALHDLMAPSRTVPACGREFWRDEFMDKFFELHAICEALEESLMGSTTRKAA